MSGDIEYRKNPASWIDGTAAVPSAFFASDTNTGLFRPGADILAVTTGGTERGRFSNTAMTLTVPTLAADGTAAAPAFSFSGDTDTGLYRIGANILGLATNGALLIQFTSNSLLPSDDGVFFGNASNRVRMLYVARRIQLDHNTGDWGGTVSGNTTDLGDGGTQTDTSTGAGTIAAFSLHRLQPITLATSANAITVTDAATLYVTGAIGAGANVTLTNTFAAWFGAAVRIDGNLRIQTAKLLANTATEIGIQVNNSAYTVGSEGSLVAPVVAGALTDATAGDLSGAIGTDTTNSRWYTRVGTTWKSVAVAGFQFPVYGIDPPTLGVPGDYDETICPLCYRQMQPGEAFSLVGDRFYQDSERKPGLHSYGAHWHCVALKALSENTLVRERLKELLQTTVGVR